MNKQTQIIIGLTITGVIVGTTGYFLNLVRQDFKEKSAFRNLQVEEVRLNVNIKMCQGYNGTQSPRWQIDKDNKFVCYDPRQVQATATPTPFKTN